MKEYILNSWQDYWEIFDELIKLLKTSNDKDLIFDFIQAQQHVNSLTDGWYDYKFSLEKALEKNRHYMTEEQIQISELQISEINKSLTNREKQKRHITSSLVKCRLKSKNSNFGFLFRQCYSYWIFFNLVNGSQHWRSGGQN